MKHARKDYDQIQDPSGKIPEDEPVFLIRAQDMVGPKTVEAWASFARAAGASEEIVDRARVQATRMRNWQSEHARKIPDL